MVCFFIVFLTFSAKLQKSWKFIRYFVAFFIEYEGFLSIMPKLPPLFNPSNDMALAANVREYTPPKRIRLMEEELQELSRCWEEGPWGWSLATKQRYEKMGIEEDLLPGDEWLKEVRRLASREFSCQYLQDLLKAVPSESLLGRDMRFCTSIDEGQEGRIYKSLWSSSGRGIFTADGLSKVHLRERLEGLLSAQGGYVEDKFYENKLQDCAMEFKVDTDGEVEFLGYSVFKAERNGTYQYNIVESQQTLRSMIGVEDELLEALIKYHKTQLGKTAYRGYVGIDMLTTEDGKLHPVVEINFRMNMGILALMLFEKYGSRANVQLTPRREHGFEAGVKDGKLSIDYKP